MGLPASCARVRENSSRAFGNRLRHAAQHALALERGQAASGAESLHGGGDGGFGMLAPALDDPRNHAAIEGRANFDEVAVLHPPAVHKKTVGCDWGDRHLRHVWPPRGRRQRF